MRTSANLESELHDKLNAPSMEDQKAKCGRDLEKLVNDRMVVMREVVVRAFVLTSLPRFSNGFLHRKSRDVLRSTTKR